MKDILDKVKNIYTEKVKPILEKTKPILEKVKPILEKVKPIWDKVVALLKEHKRYVATAGLFVVFVVVLVFFAGPEFNADRIAKQNSIEVSGEDYVPDAEFEVDAYPELNALIEQYFKAYVAADLTTLDSLVSPLSDMEKS